MKLYNGECLEVMDLLIGQGVKVDAIICDPPYGTTQNKWDSVINFSDMWKRLKLLRDDRTPIVLFGSEPFSSALRMSNIKEFKYDWIWRKNSPSGSLNANRMPMKLHENISLFYKKQCLYNPQKTKGKMQKKGGCVGGGNYGETKSKTYVNDLYYPLSIQEFKKVSGSKKVHTTEKPVDLLEYLIRTYTNEGELVLDFTMGSGSTGVACKNINRDFIGIELDKGYYDIACERISTI